LTQTPEFVPFPKIPRLRRTVIITEKLDGTNAQVHVTDSGRVFAGSRNRWLTPEKDNYGFAAWVEKHKDELSQGLGPGTHYGEWWGAGIARRYGISEKRFSLFNTSRWNKDNLPACCHVVPVISTRELDSMDPIYEALEKLKTEGSLAAPGFMNPEGVVVYMTASGTMHKVLLEHDELPKGLVPYAEKQLQATGPYG
jgi:hypothetical protein